MSLETFTQFIEISQRLSDAPEKDRQTFEVSPSGYGIHWPSVALVCNDLNIFTGEWRKDVFNSTSVGPPSGRLLGHPRIWPRPGPCPSSGHYVLQGRRTAPEPHFKSVVRPGSSAVFVCSTGISWAVGDTPCGCWPTVEIARSSFTVTTFGQDKDVQPGDWRRFGRPGDWRRLRAAP